MSAPTVVVAGGGTAGHIEPAMALADAVCRLRPGTRVVALGTSRGLEGTLIPARGYPLELIPPVPMPRRPSVDLLKMPGRVRAAVARTREVLERVGADVVVGFGGYVALPAYLAARGRVPVVVHEANVRPGLANKVGARFAAVVATAVPGTGLPGERVVGVPLRQSISTLDRPAVRATARAHFGLHPDAPTLLVTGGSQGARTLNDAATGAAGQLAAAGIGVLHAYGRKNTVAVQQVPGAPAYVALPYVDRMDLAYAAADLIVCRAGMMTVAEVSAVGLPAVFVPLPIGNGEQALNAGPVVRAGGARLVPDAEFTAERLVAEVLPLLAAHRVGVGGPAGGADPLSVMGAAARTAGHAQADELLARLTLEVIRG
jgi:UDP-N-acetylglucosamine--N-acetylmuramyl-(pentapeptide) pyrophosphoryl-undecaprenol N-acetylglucosamine transferase